MAIQKLVFKERKTLTNPTPRTEEVDLEVVTFKDIDLTNENHIRFLDSLLADASRAYYRPTFAAGEKLVSLNSVDELIADATASAGITAEQVVALHDAVKAWLTANGKSGQAVVTFLGFLKKRFKGGSVLAVNYLETYSALLGGFASKNPELLEEHREVLDVLSKTLTALIEEARKPQNPEDLLSGL